MSQYIHAMTLGDIFDRTFKMFGKTYKKNLMVALVLLVPPMLLMFLCMLFVASTVSGMMDTFVNMDSDFDGDQFLTEILPGIIFPLILAYLLMIVSAFTTIWAYISLMFVVGREMEENPVEWKEALSLGWKRIWRGIGFTILYIGALMAMFMVPYILAIIGVAADSTAIAIIGMLIVFLAFIPMIWLSVRWMFGYNSIASENTGVIEAFKRSSALVQGKWWRTFGIYMLWSIIVGFAVSLIITPIAFVGIIGPYIDLISSMTANTEPDPTTIIGLINGLVVGYGLAISLAVILDVITEPVYMTVMYYDLRARSGEFDEPEVSPELPGTDPDAAGFQNTPV
ncbi:MAG: hypothetical protein CL946_01845 [Ectothiorhodospiraceae bacterium]|nr:hypothetical protein [Ectothiorhodospiraceae bacterium]